MAAVAAGREPVWPTYILYREKRVVSDLATCGSRRAKQKRAEFETETETDGTQEAQMLPVEEKRTAGW
jgi:hypothetical protein